MARVLITGSTEGLGLAAAQSLLGDAHEVVLHARSHERASTLSNVTSRALAVVVGDLRSHAETCSIASQVNEIGRMDAVIHNAGIYRTADRDTTGEGHAGILAVNALAPYILTALIQKPRRLIYLSSSEHYAGSGPLQDVDWKRRRWDAARAYGESKLFVVALASALARTCPDVLCNSVDPGWAQSRMGGPNAPVSRFNGQRTQSWLAVSEESDAIVTGHYWHQMRRAYPAPEATDTAYQNGLISELARLTGVALNLSGRDSETRKETKP
jgi:NAD(P)-dependent dehydrogenase (short-subunit alcohol dehydrogenase family)